MPVTRDDFSGELAQAEVVSFIVNALLEGAPFTGALTRYSTARGSVVFPVVSPTGFDWTAEGAPVPAVDPGDAVHSRAVQKLSGIISLTNEMLGDSVIPVSQLLARAVQDSMSAMLDDGLLHGSGTPPE